MEEQQPTNKAGWMKRLADHWGVAPQRVLLILVVFACTGTTVLLLKRPVVAFFTSSGEGSGLFTCLYYILILPIYNVFLLIYGGLFGQFRFFWQFEKRFFGRLLRKKS